MVPPATHAPRVKLSRGIHALGGTDQGVPSCAWMHHPAVGISGTALLSMNLAVVCAGHAHRQRTVLVGHQHCSTTCSRDRRCQRPIVLHISFECSARPIPASWAAVASGLGLKCTCEARALPRSLTPARACSRGGGGSGPPSPAIAGLVRTRSCVEQYGGSTMVLVVPKS